MPNYNVNQTSDTINLPDRTGSNIISSLPNEPTQKPDEQIPPIEVPGRTDIPEDIPEKSVANQSI